MALQLPYSLSMCSWQSVWLCLGLISSVAKDQPVLCRAVHAVVGLHLEAKFFWGRGGDTQPVQSARPMPRESRNMEGQEASTD